MQEITHNIALNLSQPNNFEYIHIMQGDYNAEKVIATLFDGNKLYTINAQKASLQGSTSDGGLILQDGITISADKHQVTFEITKEMSSCTGELTCNIVFSSDNQKKSTFPFIIKNTADITGRTPVSVLTTISDYVDRAEKAASDAEKTLKDKADKDHKHTKSDITDFPTLGTASSKDVAASGNASVSQVVMGNDTRLSDARKASDVSAWAKASVKPSYSKSEVGLGNVDNTSDTSKPVSTAQQTAIDIAYVNANKYTDKKVADLIGSAPETMDTLEEVAAAIQENKDVETALNAAIGTKANQSELDTHTGNSTIHITASERTKWNVAKTHADSAHARTDATKVEKSTTNGNIKINGTETTVYTHPSGTNPHGTTKSDVGLGNVGNFKAVSTVESQGLTDTEKSNARANIGAQVAGSYASSTHTHDDRYYTGSEIDSKLSGKANSSHAHTKSQITDFPTSMPANGGTADTSKMSAKLQTYKSGSTTETYGTTYPVYAQWSSDGSKVNLKCDNYKVATDYATSAGSASSTSKATKADYITGFLQANSDQTWGNQTGTFIAGMDDSSGGSIAFRRDNPSDGKLSVIIDGNFYQNEGQFSCLDTNNYSSYALPLSGGTVDGAVTFGKNDSYGIFTSTDNYCSIGSSSAYFYRSYIKNMYANCFTINNHLSIRPSVTSTTDPEYTDVHNSVWIHGIDSSDYYGTKKPGLLLRQGTNFFQVFPVNNSSSSATDIGHSSYRFRNIVGRTLYSDSGTVSTSDRNLKHDITNLSDEIVEKLVDGLIPKSFKFNDGDSGRTHYGIIAQELEELIISIGIDPNDFAPLVKVWEDKIVKTERNIIGQDGNPQTIIETTIEKDTDKEPTYHIRYEEFIMILVQYCQNLKKKNTDLEDKYNELTSKVNEILKKLN